MTLRFVPVTPAASARLATVAPDQGARENARNFMALRVRASRAHVGRRNFCVHRPCVRAADALRGRRRGGLGPLAGILAMAVRSRIAAALHEALAPMFRRAARDTPRGLLETVTRPDGEGFALPRAPTAARPGRSRGSA